MIGERIICIKERALDNRLKANFFDNAVSWYETELSKSLNREEKFNEIGIV